MIVLSVDVHILIHCFRGNANMCAADTSDNTWKLGLLIKFLFDELNMCRVSREYDEILNMSAQSVHNIMH